MLVRDLLREISSGYFFGVFPIDLTLHFFIGAGITIFCFKKNISYKKTFFILVAIAGIKELNDYAFHFYAGWQEYLTDFVVTFSYFALHLGLSITRKQIGKPKNRKYQKIKFKR